MILNRVDELTPRLREPVQVPRLDSGRCCHLGRSPLKHLLTGRDHRCTRELYCSPGTKLAQNQALFVLVNDFVSECNGVQHTAETKQTRDSAKHSSVEDRRFACCEAKLTAASHPAIDVRSVNKRE